MPAQKLADKHSLKIMNMEPTAIPPNNSHQHLMNDCDLDIMNSRNDRRGVRVTEGITKQQWCTVAILCFVNLINYMDRYTIAGILGEIQTHYNVDDGLAGLLQTAFVLSYMLFAPIFGYMGDRYSRRWIMAFGVFLWSLTTLLGSFMNNYVMFLLFRTLVGIGEASYSTIAPTIISDLFVQDCRSKMLALFYFAIPVGSGLGYIVGSETAKAANLWQAGLRVTPALGAVATLLIIFCMVDPPRGESEGKSGLEPTTWSRDIKLLVKNKSFMLSTGGFTCVAFVAGALAWWGPMFITYGQNLQGPEVKLSESSDSKADDTVALIFGIVTMIGGIIGVPTGAFLSAYFRPRFPRTDPLVCGISLFVGFVFTIPTLLFAGFSTNYCYVVALIAMICVNMSWSIVSDMLLYVVVPTRRSTAEAFQILISHAFGDAGSPYLVGLVSEKLKAVLGVSTTVVSTLAYSSGSDSLEVKFKSLQYALFIMCFVEVIGGIFFLLTALYIVQDKAEAEREVKGVDNPVVPTHLYADDPQLNRSEINLTTA